MALRDEIPELIEFIQSKQGIISHNAELFEIYEGDLLKSVLADLRAQLSPQNYLQIQHRTAPVNVLRRLIDKLAKIYAKPPQRSLAEDSAQDRELFDWYQKCYDINVEGDVSNEFFNLFKNTALEPYIRDGKPALRVLPSDRFLVYSKDRVDPTRPTHFIKFMGPMVRTKRVGKQSVSEVVQVYYIYTDKEFLPVDSQMDVVEEILIANKNPKGMNPYGKIPFVYINRSRHNLIPIPDTDTLRMTKIFPILLSDLNFAVMYQAFSIVYGIDIDTQGDMTMSPSAFWSFKSDATGQRAPSIGVLKPQVDIQQVINFIMSQLSFWLQSRSIRPGSVGQVSAENFSSGVSKIVDEMDTFEERQKQIPFFKQAETELWDLTMHYLHPVWAREGLIEERREFSPLQETIVEFPEQKPMVIRAEVIENVKEEMSLGLLSKKDALMRLNPEMTEEEAEDYLEEIDAENTVEVQTGQEEDQPAEEEGAPGANQEEEEQEAT